MGDDAQHRAVEAVSVSAVVLALVVTGAHVQRHLRVWKSPLRQTLYVRILLLPAVFGVMSLASLFLVDLNGLFHAARDLYEAYALFVFVVLIKLHTGGEARLAQFLDDKRENLEHFGLTCRMCCPPFASGHQLLQFVRLALLQFMVVKPALVLVVFGLEVAAEDADKAGNEGRVDSLHEAMFSLRCIVGVSVVVALYALFNLFSVSRSLLLGLSPVRKFLCVKAIVFLTLVQQFVSGWLVMSGRLGGDSEYDANSRSVRLQAMLLCLESLIFSIVFLFVFSSREFSNHDVNTDRPPMSRRIAQVLRLTDIVVRRVELHRSFVEESAVPLDDDVEHGDVDLDLAHPSGAKSRSSREIVSGE